MKTGNIVNGPALVHTNDPMHFTKKVKAEMYCNIYFFILANFLVEWIKFGGKRHRRRERERESQIDRENPAILCSV